MRKLQKKLETDVKNICISIFYFTSNVKRDSITDIFEIADMQEYLDAIYNEISICGDLNDEYILPG